METIRRASDRFARDTFTVTKRPTRSYDMTCKLCDVVSKAWDYHQNVLAVGYAHSFAVHGINSTRGRWSASVLFPSSDKLTHLDPSGRVGA